MWLVCPDKLRAWQGVERDRDAIERRERQSSVLCAKSKTTHTASIDHSKRYVEVGAAHRGIVGARMGSEI